MTNAEVDRRQSRCALFAAATLSFLCTLGCDSNSIDLDREASAVMDMVTPVVGSVLADSGNLRSGMRLSRSRQVQMALTWSEYEHWLDSQALLGYQRSRADHNMVAFVRRLSGDELDLYVEEATEGPPLHVRVTFLSLPD